MTSKRRQYRRQHLQPSAEYNRQFMVDESEPIDYVQLDERIDELNERLNELETLGTIQTCPMFCLSGSWFSEETWDKLSSKQKKMYFGTFDVTDGGQLTIAKIDGYNDQ